MKYKITFYFPNKTTKSFNYSNLNDILYDLQYDLCLHDNSCEYWIIERINYD